jgi:hypothetical protein
MVHFVVRLNLQGEEEEDDKGDPGKRLLRLVQLLT